MTIVINRFQGTKPWTPWISPCSLGSNVQNLKMVGKPSKIHQHRMVNIMLDIIVFPLKSLKSHGKIHILFHSKIVPYHPKFHELMVHMVKSPWPSARVDLRSSNLPGYRERHVTNLRDSRHDWISGWQYMLTSRRITTWKWWLNGDKLWFGYTCLKSLIIMVIHADWRWVMKVWSQQ